MKKIIAFLSVALMAGCMVALAEDSGINNQANDAQKSADTSMNQAGTAADNTANSAEQTTTDTVKSTTTTAKNAAKTCVDENGNTLKKGEAGFKSCIKKEMSKQQGGMVGKDADKSTTTDQQHSEDYNKTNDNSG
jgi:hypothetical protein